MVLSDKYVYTPLRARRELVMSDLYEFVRYFWDTFEPFPFVEEDYIEFLCECFMYMQLPQLPKKFVDSVVSDKKYAEIKDKYFKDTGILPKCDVRDKLFRGEHVHNHNINIHPRAGKSLIVNVCGPVWLMLHNPIMSTSVSHSQDLSREFIDKKRLLLNSDKFRRMFPEDEFRLRYDSSTLVEMNNLGKSYSTSMKSFTGRGSHCFVGSTLVTLSNGTSKRICDCEVGDRVLSFNHSTGLFESDEIVATRRIDCREVVDVELSCGVRSEVTQDHRYWVFGRGYVEVCNLCVGDEVMYLPPAQSNFVGGSNQVVSTSSYVRSVGTRGRESVVYDIQTRVNNNFFADGILVHNCILNDDLCNVQDARADGKVLQAAKDYIRYTQSTRLNDPKTGVTCHIMQRICKGDVSDMITSDPDLSKLYSNTILKAVATEDEAFIFPCSGKIWLRRKGDPLAKKRFGDYSLEKLKLGEIDFECQFQQNVALSGVNIVAPEDISNNVISREDFANVTKISHYASHDCPVKDLERSDFHGYVEAYADEYGTLFITDALLERLSFEREREFMINLEAVDPSIFQVVEDKANGSVLLQVLSGTLSGLIPFNPGTKSKMARLELAVVYLRQGRVKFVESERVNSLCQHLREFPTLAHDDDVDAFTQLVLTHFTQKNTFIYSGVFSSQNIISEPHQSEYVDYYYGVTEDKGIYFAIKIRYDQTKDIFTVVEEKKFTHISALSDFLKSLPPGAFIYDCSVNQQIVNLTQYVFGLYEFEDENVLLSVSIVKGGFAKNRIQVVRDCNITILDIMRWRSPNKEFKNLPTDYDITTERVARCIRGVVAMVKGHSNYWL